MIGFDLADHIAELAEELGVLIWDEWEGDCEDVPCGAAGTLTLGGDTQPVILLSDPPITPESYLVALHELGHHATRDEDEFNRELRAWLWAVEHARIDLDLAGAYDLIIRRLETYRA